MYRFKGFVLYYLLAAALFQAEKQTGTVGLTNRDMKVGAASFFLGTLSIGVCVYVYQLFFAERLSANDLIKQFFKGGEKIMSYEIETRRYLTLLKLDAVLEKLFPEEKKSPLQFRWSFKRTYARISAITYASVAPQIACEDKKLISIKEDAPYTIL